MEKEYKSYETPNFVRLRIWLKENGYTQKDFSAFLGVSRNTLYKYCNSKTPPRTAALAIEYLTRGALKADDWD